MEDRKIIKGVVACVIGIIAVIAWIIITSKTGYINLLSPLFITFIISFLYACIQIMPECFPIYAGWVTFCIVVYSFYLKSNGLM